MSEFKLSDGIFAINLSSMCRFEVGSASLCSCTLLSVVARCLFFTGIESNDTLSGVGVFLGAPRRLFRVSDDIFFWYFVSFLPYLSVNRLRWLMFSAPSVSIRVMSRNIESSCGCVSLDMWCDVIVAVRCSTCSCETFPIHIRPWSFVSCRRERAPLYQ